jgi:hypothetical protein
MLEKGQCLFKVWLPYITRFQNPKKVSLPFCINITTYYNTSIAIKTTSPKNPSIFSLKIRLEVG